MPWIKLDDSFHAHPKVLAAGLEAIGLHIVALSHCSRYLTDGHVIPEVVKQAAGSRGRKLTERLVDVGLWDEVTVGWQIHDYLEYNPSAEEMKTKREWDNSRKSLERDRSLVAAIKKRDANRCRYCGEKVNWRDRKGTRGATYDHVIPRGPNTVENVVVACRECNFAKGGRTPDEAGLVLLPAASEPGGNLHAI